MDPLAPARSFQPPPRPVQEPVAGYLDQDVNSFFYRWGGHLSAALIRIRGAFDGDLDQYVIFLIFILTELSQAKAADEAIRRGRPPASRIRGLNALSIAEITRIPRETTRRKLKALAGSGYLNRGPDGLHYLSGRMGVEEVFRDLSPLFWEAIKVEQAG